MSSVVFFNLKHKVEAKWIAESVKKNPRELFWLLDSLSDNNFPQTCFTSLILVWYIFVDCRNKEFSNIEPSLIERQIDAIYHIYLDPNGIKKKHVGSTEMGMMHLNGNKYIYVK